MGLKETNIHNETSIYNQTSIHNETSIQSILVSRESSRNNAVLITSVVVFGVLIALALFFVRGCAKWCWSKLITTSSGLAAHRHDKVSSDNMMRNTTVERFMLEMAEENPTRFTPEQLAGYTLNYATRLGAGGFGTVYRGTLPNGLAVAVKVLDRAPDARTSEKQFMTEMRTIGRTHHVNLVRLYGFCYDADTTCSLVYEFMERGSLEDYLSSARRAGTEVSMPMMAAVATGVARGLRYLHEECQHKIIHYDIKPGNILLDGTLTPKVADFGLAHLIMNRANTHVSVSHWRGTPGFVPPEMGMGGLRVTEKCDVYSFGILLLNIVEHGSNFHGDPDATSEGSRQWFPMVAWTRYEAGKLMELMVPTVRHDPRCRELVERMCKVAFWCAQQRPSARPSMSLVVKMLEGETEITLPPNPFEYVASDVNTASSASTNVLSF